MAYVNRHSAHIEYIKPNTKVKTKRQKVPDDEDIDMDKIVKDYKPRYDRKCDFKKNDYKLKKIQKDKAKRLVLQ